MGPPQTGQGEDTLHIFLPDCGNFLTDEFSALDVKGLAALQTVQLLFLAAGAVLYATGTTDLDKLGGLSKRMPKTTICFLVGAFSISGLPPFNGFASKWMIYQSTFAKAAETGNFAYAFVTIVALVVSVMTLASFIKVTQAVFFGQLPKHLEETKEVPMAMQIPMWWILRGTTRVGAKPKV